MNRIHISEIKKNRHRWTDTSFLRFDNKMEFREKPEFGNRHVVFSPNSLWGIVHRDAHNAVDFPIGTLNHLAKYTNEKTGVPESIAKIALVLIGLYVGYKVIKNVGVRL